MTVIVFPLRNILVSLLSAFKNITYVDEEPWFVPFTDIVHLVQFNLAVLNHFTGHNYSFVESILQPFYVVILLRISASTFEFIDNILATNNWLISQANVSETFKIQVKR